MSQPIYIVMLLPREELFDKNSGVSPVGKDYYTIMLCFDILTFITIVFGASSFGVSALLVVAHVILWDQLLVIP